MTGPLTGPLLISRHKLRNSKQKKHEKIFPKKFEVMSRSHFWERRAHIKRKFHPLCGAYHSCFWACLSSNWLRNSNFVVFCHPFFDRFWSFLTLFCFFWPLESRKTWITPWVNFGSPKIEFSTIDHAMSETVFLGKTSLHEMMRTVKIWRRGHERQTSGASDYQKITFWNAVSIELFQFCRKKVT